MFYTNHTKMFFCSLKYFPYLKKKKISRNLWFIFQLIFCSKERSAIVKGFLVLDVGSGQRLCLYQLCLICQFPCLKKWLNSSLFLIPPCYIYIHIYITKLRESFVLRFREEEITIYSIIHSITPTHS